MERMGKYLLLFSVVIFAVSSIVMVYPANASNTWIWESGIAPIPEITWENPEITMIYSTLVPLEFNITYPRPENFAVGSDMYYLHIIEYSIDGANSTSVGGQYYQDNKWSSGQLNLDTSRMSNGLHNITVTAYFTVLWGNIGSPTDQPYAFPQTSFRINNQITEQPTPTPSVPESSWLIILPILLAIPIVLVMIRKTVSKNITVRI